VLAGEVLLEAIERAGPPLLMPVALSDGLEGALAERHLRLSPKLVERDGDEGLVTAVAMLVRPTAAATCGRAASIARSWNPSAWCTRSPGMTSTRSAVDDEAASASLLFVAGM
jgi:hypothetical protein